MLGPYSLIIACMQLINRQGKSLVIEQSFGVWIICIHPNLFSYACVWKRRQSKAEKKERMKEKRKKQTKKQLQKKKGIKSKLKFYI